MLTRVLLLLDSPQLRRSLRSFLASLDDVVVETVSRKQPLMNRVARLSGDLLLVSRSLLAEPAPQAVTVLREIPDAPQIVVLCPDEDPTDQAALLAAGCFATLDTGVELELFEEAVSTLVDRCREDATTSLDTPQAPVEPRLTDFVSASPPMQTFMSLVDRVVESDTTLLILGETGVGKERLAQAIHAESPRATGPFIPVNCGAIPEALVESELFGHEEGAFTGATRARRGWFELAHGGTVFLDEIGDLPLHIQVKLLRVLQNHEIQRVGSEGTLKVSVRVMAATNRDLDVEVAQSAFRRDLYYRLSVVTLEIPPLRDRREDIRGLVENYIAYFQSRFATPVETVSDRAIDAMSAYDWPGNVRELVNVVERAMLLCRSEKIDVADLPATIADAIGPGAGDRRQLTGTGVGSDPARWIERPLVEVREEAVRVVESEYLRTLLDAVRGRIGEAARRAGLNPRTLYTKMRELGLRKEDFRRRDDGDQPRP